MRLDRAEWTGTGAAMLFHVALIGALSYIFIVGPVKRIEFTEGQ